MAAGDVAENLVSAMRMLGEAQSAPEAVDLLAVVGAVEAEAMRLAAQLLASTNQYSAAVRAYVRLHFRPARWLPRSLRHTC